MDGAALTMDPASLLERGTRSVVRAGVTFQEREELEERERELELEREVAAAVRVKERKSSRGSIWELSW
jgi:hypothetical protein